ncbi:hypothetical protein SPI_05467 [Niveomyces insectorum RCEF 264]|uniref:2EXR domain-containing protein n=1 Tax=Niveomyces insectorum RCEF 264 TaxID=1081102 RepID=A0A167T913_9HYPO|nr:hypothetical protein SPI_05467 [Niveomyces insectorum RCEF 264]
MTSHTQAPRLAQVQVNLSELRGKLFKAHTDLKEKTDRIQRPSSLHFSVLGIRNNTIMYFLRGLELDTAAGRLAKTVSLIYKFAAKEEARDAGSTSDEQLHETRFRCFPSLPPEVQLMIWAAAAQPPPCAHYFATFDLALALDGREPAAYFKADRGLWRACRASREVVMRAYEKRQAYFCTTASDCLTRSKPEEAQHRRLARLNKGMRHFRKQVHGLHAGNLSALAQALHINSTWPSPLQGRKVRKVQASGVCGPGPVHFREPDCVQAAPLAALDKICADVERIDLFNS